MRKFKLTHKSFGDDMRDCTRCGEEFIHKLFYNGITLCHEHSGECPNCGTESIHDVEDYEVEDYLAVAEYESWLKIEIEEMNKCDESYIKKHS